MPSDAGAALLFFDLDPIAGHCTSCGEDRVALLSVTRISIFACICVSSLFTVTAPFVIANPNEFPFAS